MIIAQAWNQVARLGKSENLKPRDYIRASEIGSSFVDRYFRMKGIEPSNPFDERTLRIFDGGRSAELNVQRALILSGVYRARQTEIRLSKTSKTLEVIGHLDFEVGGVEAIDYEKQKQLILDYLNLYGLKLEESLLEQKAYQMIDWYKEKYPNGILPLTVLEVKSVNSMAFWSHKNKNAEGIFIPYPHHELQLYTYQKGRNIEHGSFCYISRDDFSMDEPEQLLGTQRLENALREDLEMMTYYFNNNEQPPLEPEMIYNNRKKIFELNWKVERSQYLTYAYGYKSKEEFEEKNHDLILDINRALKHLREVSEKEELIKNTTDPKEKEKIQKSLELVKKKLQTEDALPIRTYDLEQYIK